MAKKTRKDKDKIVLAALDLAAARGWSNVTLQDIALETKLSLAELHDSFEDKTDILVTFGRMIDREVLENIGQGDPEDSPRDRLFDILMERYEALNNYREGLVSILGSFTLDPKQAVISMPHLCRSMSWMLEAAGMDTGGLAGAIKVTGLTAIYIKGLKAWKEDDSPDLAKTMAVLDKDLGRAERAANMFGL